MTGVKNHNVPYVTNIIVFTLCTLKIYGVTKPTCPTNPVCVCVDISRHIIIHHCPDVRDVQSTSWLQKHYNSVHENNTGH